MYTTFIKSFAAQVHEYDSIYFCMLQYHKAMIHTSPRYCILSLLILIKYRWCIVLYSGSSKTMLIPSYHVLVHSSGFCGLGMSSSISLLLRCMSLIDHVPSSLLGCMHEQVWTPRLLMCWRSPVEHYRWRMRAWGRAHVRDSWFVFKSAKRTLGKRAPLHAILLPAYEIFDRATSMATFYIYTQWKVLYLNLHAQ